MVGEDAFTVEGIIIESLPNGTWRVELPNGHRLTGFVVGKARASFSAAPGTTVRLKLSPYDLSEGRIIAEIKS